VEITDLRHVPHFFSSVADRIWRAWWEPNGLPLADVEAALRTRQGVAPFPFTLVAYEGVEFLGTASAVANDLIDRPQYSPWLAALWVEAEHRKTGIGTALVDWTTRTMFDQGRSSVYICARQELTPFYQRLGCNLIEKNVGKHQLSVLSASRMTTITDRSS
jgi:GNAT superfamily N-acetyltransferase